MTTLQTTLLQDLFEQQRQYLNFFFDHLHFPQLDQVMQQCLTCKGLLILTGIGKSGLIAEKIAMTLVSTGTRALFLPAINFLHGDIGALQPEDVVLMFSKSGQTYELVKLLPFIKRKKSKTIAVVSNALSPLAQKADHYVVLPVEKELCPYDLAPTTSAAVQLLFGDVLAIALMKEKNFSLEEYAMNHPAGAIGKKITLCVRDLMLSENLPFCAPHDRLVDVIVELSNKKCGCLVVLSPTKALLGIFTDGDLRRALQKEGAKVMESKMEELMNSSPIVLEPNELIHCAIQKMQEKRYVMVAPVIENKQVVGIIRMHDLVSEGK